MMDTVYGTKKYFQSLSGGSDIYRSSTCRAVTNEYSSYQNTLGRRSGLGPYTHMNKHPSYSTDLSLGSQYAYSTWGMWRDPRNLSPSTYSSKSRHSVKSFSIILTTAAFIVLLAVVSIAGLAFYFSTFKSNLEDPIMAFEGRFRISKGDLFTTGLKYNHTSSFKQKVDFYKRFVERALSDNGLQATRVDIIGFGDGPLINVNFRVFLDMRKLPQNIHSVEEHIRQSLFLETTSLKSLYRSLRIDADSVEVKRILDQELVKSASFARDSPPPTSQTHFEKRLTKKTGTVEKAPPKIQLPQRPKPKPSDDEPDVDVENAPIIQGSFEGSFEITKTDADITRKKTSPTNSVTASTIAASSTLFSMKPKTKKTTIEKVTPAKGTENSVFKITIPTTTTTTTKTTSTTKAETTTKSTTISATTVAREKSTSTEITTPSTISTTMSTTPNQVLSNSSSSTTATNSEEDHSKYSNVQDPPKLDVKLFTSAPVLDTEPWRPIRPPHSSSSSQNNPSLLPKVKPIFSGNKQTEIEAIDSGLLPRHKIKFSDHATEEPNKMIFYHSFTNPVFMPGTSGIEKLGNADVKPHPLPVPLIDDVIIPAFKPLGTIPAGVEDFPIGIDPNDKFEHIGGGVIVKKHDESGPESGTKVENDNNAEEQVKINLPQNTSSSTTDSTPFDNSTQFSNSDIDGSAPTAIDQILQEEKQEDAVTTQLSEKLGELLYDLLDIPREDNETESLTLESRIEPELDGKPNFLSIKEHILSRNKVSNPSNATRVSDIIASSTKEPVDRRRRPNNTTPKTVVTSTKKSKVPGNPRPTLSSSDMAKTTPVTLDDSMLFPSHSKWEYVNGSSDILSSTASSAIRKVFNETLQAWVVKNIDKPENLSLKELQLQKNNTDNIQNISLIFDTLASKLGISPTMPTKVPPFVAFSQNKLKQSQKNKTSNNVKTNGTVRPVMVTKKVISSTTAALTTPTTTTSTSTTTPSSTTSNVVQPIDQAENPNASPEIIIGEAEVEVVDPTKYEEMLSSQSVSTSTFHPPSLVTLLPVRSNSGIRTFRPPAMVGESRRFSYNPRYRETVVKTGIHVTA